MEVFIFMNQQFLENQVYIEMGKKIIEAEQLLYDEMDHIPNQKKDEPFVLNLIEQYRTVINMKIENFILLLRNGFACEEKENQLKIQIGEDIFEVPKEQLKAYLEDTYSEVVEPALLGNRVSVSYALNNETKNKIEEEYRESITETLKEEIKDELRIVLTPEVCDNIKTEYKENVLSELKTELTDTAKEELRKDLEEEIKNELREKWSEQIRHELKSDMKAEVKDEIKTTIEKKVTEEESEKIKTKVLDTLKKEVEEKTEKGFVSDYMEKKNELVKSLENQSVYHIYKFKCTKGTQVEEFELKVFPLTFPTSGERSVSCKSIGLLNNEVLYKPKDGNSPLAVNVPHLNMNITVISKWRNGEFATVVYFNSTDKELEITKEYKAVHPMEFDKVAYEQMFMREVGEGDEKVTFTYIPTTRENKGNGYCPGIIHLQTMMQNEYIYTRKPIKFDCGKCGNVRLGGKWQEENFIVELENV